MSGAKKTLFGGLILILESLGKKLVGLLSTLILARVLVPEDFGLVAICTLVMGFVQIFVETGSAQYLLRAQDISKDIVDTSWTINILLKTVVVICLVLSSWHVADYFDDDRITSVLIILSLSMFLSTFTNPGLVLYRREHNYIPITKLILVSKIFSVAVAVSVALIFESYWALVLGQVTSMLTRLIGSYVIHSYRPKPCLKNAREQWIFSGWMIPQAILGYSRTQLDTFIVSSNFGMSSLGSYHVMKYLAFIPSSDILIPATQPLLVELAKVKDDTNEFIFQFNVTAIVTITLATLIAAFLHIERDAIVLILLGKQWTEYSELFGLFVLLIPALAILNQSRRVLLVFAKTKEFFVYEMIAFFSMYSWLFYLGFDDLVKFTLHRVFMENVFCLALLLYVIVRYLHPTNVLKLLLQLLPVLLSCMTSAVLVNSYLNFGFGTLTDLVISGVCFLTTFSALMFIQWIALLKYVKEWHYIGLLLLRGVKSLTLSLASGAKVKKQ